MRGSGYYGTLPSGQYWLSYLTKDVRFEDQARVAQLYRLLLNQLRRVSCLGFGAEGRAEKITSDWSSLEYRSKCIHDKLDTHTQATYFEMVHASIMLNANLNRLYLAAGKSNMYATQGRTAANIQANKALALFENDVTISQQFESLYDGKWTQYAPVPEKAC